MVRKSLTATWKPSLAAGLLWCATAALVDAADVWPGWTRESAARALSQVDTSVTVQSLTELTVAGAETDLLLLLDATRERGDWPAPARDAAVFEYARALSKLPADAVPPVVMSYLGNYTSLTWVPHDDHHHGQVPLLNVRAVARGVENGWLRQEARFEGLALLRARPDSLVDAWLIEAHPAVRAGYLEALEQSTPQHISAVSRAAGDRLAGRPGLTALAGRAALLADDEDALGVVLAQGEGPALQHLMQALPTEDATRTQRLFEAALSSANPDSATLAIALLYPSLAGTSDADAALLARLGDGTLGAPAALALATSPARDTQLALEALATTSDRPESRRARMALDLRSEQATEDMR